MQTSRTIRCAIYTRKSTEEGLEQGYNSLHAQRDACAAYVMSQAGEGWTLLPEVYDDGGYSGGNMERPALRRLMIEIEAKRVDVVVVYKVDRLTRSLPDFSKIIEVLDRAEASFVSVTQAFNTTTSMGRLTLNVLLSFAQFEREVTGERIRDKIAASKKKGLWMGGRPVIGYEPDGRTLSINPTEAAEVRWVFTRYLELKSVNRLIEEMATRGVVSKRWINKAGEAKGGLPIERGAAYHMLRNPIYVGDIPHKGLVYPGQHPALIDRDTFDAVQRLLDDSRRKRRPGRARPPHDGSPLTGLIHDSAGHVMSPVSAARKGGATYRYYVSTAVQTGRRAEAGALARVSAPVIESAIVEAMRPLFPERGEPEWEVARDVIDRVEVHRDLVRVRLCPTRCAERITTDGGRLALDCLDRNADQPILELTITIGRRGALSLAGPGGSRAIHAPRIDPALSSALVRAEAWKRQLYTGQFGSLAEIAAAEGVTVRYAARILRVAYLAPDLKRAILDGVQSERLTLETLVRQGVPLDWSEQRKRLSA